jgi:U3 small nucleolar ribonucleoprotein protein IMP3
MEAQLLSKLYDMGVLAGEAKLSDVENRLTVAAFCRRRLAVVMCASRMAETVSAVRRFRFFLLLCICAYTRICGLYGLEGAEADAGLVAQAVKFIEQGHVRVGPETITDPAFLVTRHVHSAGPPLSARARRICVLHV